MNTDAPEFFSVVKFRPRSRRASSREHHMFYARTALARSWRRLTTVTWVHNLLPSFSTRFCFAGLMISRYLLYPTCKLIDAPEAYIAGKLITLFINNCQVVHEPINHVACFQPYHHTASPAFELCNFLCSVCFKARFNCQSFVFEGGSCGLQ
jgi:hypothetical protein